METDHVVVLGAGVHGLMCALESQKFARQVDIVAQVFPRDPLPTRYTTGYSGCFIGSLKTTVASFEQHTLHYLQALTATNDSGSIREIECISYFADVVDEARFLQFKEEEELAIEGLVKGASQGVRFKTIVVNPDEMINEMLRDFVSAGGRVYRGTVRHISELVEGGVSAFERPMEGLVASSPHPPSAVIVCVGLGAGFIGGIEDVSPIRPVRVQTVRLRAPWFTTGKVFYETLDEPPFFVVPLGDGDVVVGGMACSGNWYPKPRPDVTTALLSKAEELCPELRTKECEEGDIHRLVVWEGCDLLGIREGGPRLELSQFNAPTQSQAVPVVFSYGFGMSELRCFYGVAKAVVGMLQGALEQGRSVRDSGEAGMNCKVDYGEDDEMEDPRREK